MPDDLENSTDATTPQTPEDEGPVITSLRKDWNEAKAEATAAKRELTLHKAGLGELSEQRMKALAAAHDGEWEPEALKATATELGFVQSDGGQPAPKISSEELAQHDRVATAAAGQPVVQPDLDAALAAVDLNDPNGEAKVTEILKNAGVTIS